MTGNLKPCPFCAAGTARVDEQHYWTGQRNKVLSVTVVHHCERAGNQPQSIVRVCGRDRESAIAVWNSRAGGGE